MDERSRRIGVNEAVARAVNERIEVLAQGSGTKAPRLELVCECGDATCVEQLVMTQPEYEKIRADAHLFAVYPGHASPNLEDVVARGDGYEIVRKRSGEPAMIAEQTDPRA
jgi:hypothetical protein